jgi:hypothetical protein
MENWDGIPSTVIANYRKIQQKPASIPWQSITQLTRIDSLQTFPPIAGYHRVPFAPSCGLNSNILYEEPAERRAFVLIIGMFTSNV